MGIGGGLNQKNLTKNNVKFTLRVMFRSTNIAQVPAQMTQLGPLSIPQPVSLHTTIFPPELFTMEVKSVFDEANNLLSPLYKILYI